ncbi:MAG: DMT family transporter [Streptosporangiaceae bacterium]
MNGIALAAALAGAFFYALSAALEQRQAAVAPTGRALHPAFVLDLARRPLWLAGFAAGIVGAGLHVVALGIGSLALVQPVGVTMLLFAIPIGAALRGRRPARGDLWAAVAVVVGLGGFLATLRPTPAWPDLGGFDLIVVAGLAGAGLALALVAGRGTGVPRSLALACGAGVAFGVTSALIRVLAYRATDAGVSGLIGWPSLVITCVACGGLLLEQAAYKTDRLGVVIAVITVVDPLVAITVGALVLGEPVRMGHPLLVTAEGLAMVVGVITLARSAGGTSRARRPDTSPYPTGAGLGTRCPRVLIGTDTYPPDVNGASYFTRRLAHGLAARGHDVHVVCPSTSAQDTWETDGVVTLHRVASMRTPFHRTFRVCLLPGAGESVSDVVAAVRPDVVHVQGHFLIGRVLSRIASREGLPLVATNHFMPENLAPYVPLPSWVGRPLAGLAWRDLVRVFRRADAVTTPTPIAARLLQDRGLGRPVVPVSCGIDLDRFCARRGRSRSVCPTGSMALLYVGRLDAEKRVGDLIEALPAVRERVDATLVIVGEGSRRSALERLAWDRGVAAHVHFLGFVPDAELPSVYTAADVFCMPGVAELQSLVTLEAMASGRPVVAADAVALPHLVRHGHNGFRYDPGAIDALARHLVALLTDRELRGVMGLASRATAAEHDVSRSLARFEALYADASARAVAGHAAQMRPSLSSLRVASRPEDVHVPAAEPSRRGGLSASRSTRHRAADRVCVAGDSSLPGK